jgi:hypothetical protein
MTPEERAKAVVAYFPTIPPAIRASVESVVARAVHRALKEQLAKLEIEAERRAVSACGRGKARKGREPWAIHFHTEWGDYFRFLRTGKRVERTGSLDLLANTEPR